MTARPSRPQALPEYRNAIVENDHLWNALTMLGQYVGKSDFEHADIMREWLTGDARLWWIGADAGDLVQHAAPSMPPATLTEDFCPDRCGFAFFERPLVGQDADHPEMQIEVDALFWLPTTVGRDEAAGIEYPSLSIVSWRHVDDVTGPMALGRADWPFGYDTDQQLPGMGDSVHASIMEDRRNLAALWQLSSQAGLTESVDRLPDRPTQKRLQRARKSIPEVRCVSLAPHRRGPREGATGASERTYTRRWIVEGHWRQQACGPQWSQRRPVFIAPHIKGPDDAPLVEADVVKVWRG